MDDKILKIWALKLKGGQCQCKQAKEDESGCTNVKTVGPHVNIITEDMMSKGQLL